MASIPLATNFSCKHTSKSASQSFPTTARHAYTPPSHVSWSIASTGQSLHIRQRQAGEHAHVLHTLSLYSVQQVHGGKKNIQNMLQDIQANRGVMTPATDDLSSRKANKMQRRRGHPVTNSHAISHTKMSLTCILNEKKKN